MIGQQILDLLKQEALAYSPRGITLQKADYDAVIYAAHSEMVRQQNESVVYKLAYSPETDEIYMSRVYSTGRKFLGVRPRQAEQLSI